LKLLPTFAGHVALVTGASSGIGREIALQLMRGGACIWAVGRRRSILENALGREHAGLRLLEVDLASDQGLVDLTAVLDQQDGLDILVHSAGRIHLGRFEEVSLCQFDEQYQVNLRAPFAITQGALPALRRRRGQVVFINSLAGLRVSEEATQYSATKFGLRAIANGLRDEVNCDGIRVLTAFVGRTATEMQATVFAHEGRPWDPRKLLQPSDVAKAILAALAMPRSAEVYEISLRPTVKLDHERLPRCSSLD
jgi:short-subunit dehydrogenase